MGWENAGLELGSTTAKNCLRILKEESDV